MPYSEQEMKEISRDPNRLRRYFWRVAMGAKRRAARARREVKDQAVRSSPVLFHDAVDDARERLRRASIEESFAAAILDNLDAWVKSSLER
jgi:hypothetical protein